MYAANKKDINRHKKFHALSGANIAKRENLKAEKREREEKQEERMAQLEKERREARLDAQFDSAEGHSSGFTSIQKRTAWMLETTTTNGNGSDGGAQPEKELATSAAGPAQPTTGIITKEEAEAARKRISDEKKRRLDPLARAESEIDSAVRSRLLSGSSFGLGVPQPVASASQPSANQAKMLSLLARARK